MRKWNINLLSVALLSAFLFGCFGQRKIQTRTITTTVIRIDTIIKIQNDTILKMQTVTLRDTAILENQTSIARSYFSTQKQKIVLELKGKSFDVPITVYKSVVKDAQVKESLPTTKKWFDKYLIAFFILIIVYLIWKDRKTLFAK